MAGYDINSIEIVDEKQPELSKLLTDDYIKGLSPKSPIQSNAEVEGGEYIQFPDNTVVKALGNRHEQGGVKVSLPDGTKIESDFLKPTKRQIKLIEKEFGLSISSKDTYAKVMDKYLKKVGYEALSKEQEELFKELEKVVNKRGIDPNTASINQQYLNNKINDIEKQKEAKNPDKERFFKIIFAMQEQSKPKEERAEGYRDGGKFQDGGGITYRISEKENEYKGEKVESQKPTKDAGYGRISDTQSALQNLYENFPDIITTVYKDYVIVENGKVSFKNKVDFNKQNELVLKMQEGINKRMVSSANDIIKNPKYFSEEDLERAKKYLSDQTFIKDGKTTPEKVRGFDKMLGQFTSGRYSLGLDFVTPEEQKTIIESGITTLNQIPDDILKTLSPESQKRIKQIRDIKGEDSDYAINAYTPPKDLPEVVVTAKRNPTKVEDEPINNYVGNPPVNRGPKMFFQPDQSALPPSPMEAHLKGNVRFGRIDPVRIGIDQNLQEISDQQSFVASQLDSLPDNQRTAAFTSLLAQGQKAANQAITSANVTNAQNISQAELVNIQQADKEEIYNLNNALSFEQRQLTAKAKSDEEMRRWLDYNRRVRVSNFQNQQRLNLLDSMFPQFDLDFSGMTVNYNGTGTDPRLMRAANETDQNLAAASASTAYTPATDAKGKQIKYSEEERKRIAEATALINAIGGNIQYQS